MVEVQQYNNTTIQQYNNTTIQQYNNTTIQQYSNLFHIFAVKLPTSLSRYRAIGNEESPDNVEQPHHLTGGIFFEKSKERQQVSQKITASIRRGKGENVR